MQNVEEIKVLFKIGIMKNLAAVFFVIITILFIRHVRLFYFLHWDQFLSLIAIYIIATLPLLKVKSIAINTMLLSAIVIPSTLLNGFIFYGHVFYDGNIALFLGGCVLKWFIHGGFTVLVGLLFIELCCFLSNYRTKNI
jgi:hypothetical protein